MKLYYKYIILKDFFSMDVGLSDRTTLNLLILLNLFYFSLSQLLNNFKFHDFFDL